MFNNYLGKRILHTGPANYKSTGTDDFFEIGQVYTIDAIVWFDDHCIYFTREVPDVPYTGQFKQMDSDMFN